ncbi:hypothetical protein ACOZ4N_20355 (plasmid) [Halorientalis pallida]|uniref:hypothetical protein n=1 Tax=Halorientalis pallida TaxID=2479928 RepID=UPI003C6FCE68
MTPRKRSFVFVGLWLTVGLLFPGSATAVPTGGEPNGWDCSQCTRPAQADQSNGTAENPLGFMTAEATRESATTFRVTFRNTGLIRSAGVATPGDVGRVDNGELRGLSAQSYGGPSTFDLSVAVAGELENLSRAARGELSPPATLDRPLLYVNATATAPSRAFTVTYSFDAERDDLRDDGVTRDDLQVLAYYGGKWNRLTNVTGYPDGSDAVVNATTSGTVPLAFGYPRPELTVTNLSQQSRLFANRSGTISATVVNRGHRDGEGTFEVETRNDTVLRNHTIFAEAGQRRTVEIPVAFPGPGEWPVDVDDAETTVQVERPRPAFVVSNLSLSSGRIAPGESVTARATVTNDGRADGAGVVRLRTFDTVVDAKRFRLRRNASRRVTFTQRFDAAGTYTVRVGNRSRTVVVGNGGRPPVANTATAETPASRTGSDVPMTVRWALVVIGAGAVLLFGLAALGRIVRGS